MRKFRGDGCEGRNKTRKKAADKKERFGADLIEGIKLVVAHQSGEFELG